MKNQDIIKAVEKLVDPIESGAMHVIQQYNQMLPVRIQNKLVASSATKNPYMGFIVEPYALFTCHKIIDFDYINEQLQTNFKLIKTHIFDGDIDDYYLIIGSFGLRTSAFFGNRIEAYVICEDMNTGLLTWVIIDVLSNTIGYEQRLGLVPANADVAVTTSFNQEIVVTAKADDRSYQANCSLQGTELVPDSRLWIEGNLSVGYGKKIATNGDAFPLLFDVHEVDKGIKVDNYQVDIDDWFKGICESQPNVVLYFPYAQHFISASPGAKLTIKNQAEMEQVLSEIDFEQLTVYSSKGMFKLQQLIMLGMFITIIGLIAFIIIT